MTREDLEARLAQLLAECERAVAQVNAYQGAIAECRYWLDRLSKPEPAKA
jgi:hypothetical protein